MNMNNKDNKELEIMIINNKDNNKFNRSNKLVNKLYVVYKTRLEELDNMQLKVVNLQGNKYYNQVKKQLKVQQFLVEQLSIRVCLL